MTDWDGEQRYTPGPAEPQGGWFRRKRFLIVGVAVAIALGYLGFTAFQGASMYYLTVDELLARTEDGYGERVRVMGKVVDGSVEKDSETDVLHFAVAGEDGASLPVAYTGMVPDAFKQGAEVVVEGNWTPGHGFAADELLVKCPSKYEAPPEDSQVEGGD